MGLDVDERRQVQLLGARTVARLPDREQLRQAPPVPRGEWRLHRVERMRQGRGDPALVQVGRALLDVTSMCLEPFVILAPDPVAEDVDRPGLAAEPGRQLLGDERIGKIDELEGSGDRVVIGDRHEVHPAALGQLVYLVRRGGALGQV